MPENYSADGFLTGQTIVTATRDEALNSSSSQITALQDTQIAEFVHWLNGDFIAKAHDFHHAGGWSWMQKTSNFSVYQHQTLNGAVAASAATFILNSATNWDDSGRSAIESARGALDFVDHSSKATHTLTVSTVSGAETISMAHVTGSRVHKLYATPGDFSRVRRLFINQVPYDEYRGYLFPPGRHYSLYGSFFLLPRGTTTADATLYYEKTPATISALTSTTDIPRRFQRWAIEMTLFHLFRIRRKRGDLQTTDQLAARELRKALNYDSASSTSTAIRLA